MADTNKDIQTDNNKEQTTIDKPTTDNNKTTKRGNKNNLIPINKRPIEEQRAIREKAGKRSGEVRKERKQARELLTEILNRTMTNESIEEVLGESKMLLGDDKTAYNVLLVKMLTTAMQGNTTAMQLVRDTVGDAPINKQQIEQTVLTDADKELINNVRKRLLG